MAGVVAPESRERTRRIKACAKASGVTIARLIPFGVLLEPHWLGRETTRLRCQTTWLDGECCWLGVRLAFFVG